MINLTDAFYILQQSFTGYRKNIDIYKEMRKNITFGEDTCTKYSLTVSYIYICIYI